MSTIVKRAKKIHTLGDRGLRDAYPPAFESARRQTKPGMASWCDPFSLHTCGQCRNFKEEKALKGRRLLFQQRMNGKRGDLIGRDQRACTAWQNNLPLGRTA
jgi:hypothetical protein